MLVQPIKFEIEIIKIKCLCLVKVIFSYLIKIKLEFFIKSIKKILILVNYKKRAPVKNYRAVTLD